MIDNNKEANEYIKHLKTDYSDIVGYFLSNLDESNGNELRKFMFKYGGENYPKSKEVMKEELEKIVKKLEDQEDEENNTTVDAVMMELLGMSLSRFEVFKRDLTEEEIMIIENG